jgi:hypothetical protein
MEPVWDGKAFVPRLMLPLSLSWDHRVIDGAAAAALQTPTWADPGGLPSRVALTPRTRMTTVVVVRKNGQVAIAGDSLVTFGDTRLAHGYEANDKLFKVGDSWIGMSGTTAHFPGAAPCAQRA